MPLFADQAFNGRIENHGKALLGTSHHRPLDLHLVIKLENRKLEFNGLALCDPPRGADINACGTNVFNDIPKRSLFGRILGDDKRRPSGKLALVLF